MIQTLIDRSFRVGSDILARPPHLEIGKLFLKQAEVELWQALILELA
jgi:hypothetical protein